jgi:hypothetical protein
MPEVKDKMTGKTIAKMPYDSQGQMEAQKMVSKNPGYEIKDGAMRSEQNYAGGGKTGFNRIGMQNPKMNTGNQPMADPPGYNWAEDVIPQEDNFNFKFEEGGKVKYKDGGKAKKEYKGSYNPNVVPKKIVTEAKEYKVKSETKDKKLKDVKKGYKLQWFARNYPGGNVPNSLKAEYKRLLDRRLKVKSKKKKK